MVSRRKFFSIAIMMFVLLFLFQFSMVLRDRQNTYDVNSNLAPKQNDGKNVWKNEELDPASVGTTDRRYVLFVGDSSSDMAEAVSRWCTYAKWDISKCSSMEKFKESDKNLPGMLILESEKYALDDNLKKIEELEQKGVLIVFGCLEDPKNIEKNQELQDFLGIYKIVSKKTELTGVKLFEGLLLGGEVVYETPEDKDERDRQDLQLDVPWYQVGSGTKTYMVGLLDQSKQKETVENEELPTLIWRNGIRNGSIFCVVGDYMKDSTALGLLDGMVAEASSYYIYPVVNAQNLSMINFPVFADENNEQMMELYSQSITGMARDIMWPSLISIVEKGGLKMTCFMQPQTNYEDGIEPTSKDLVFYLKQMKEQNAEAGLSLQYKNAESLRDKLNQDAEFFRKADSSYKYGAAYTEEKDLDTVKALMNTELMKNVSTLVCEYTEDEPVISYCTDSVTLQSVTSDGMNYTYSDDIRMRSIQSSLGYTNVMLNMQKIFWPERKKDRWQIMQKRFSSNLLTYWKNFTGFDSTTLSESNTRTRTFLNLDFSETRTDDEITLKTSESGSWFILRTYGEEIEEIEGGTQKKLEDNVYLIQAQDTTVKIQVKTAGLHYSK
ncbi:DUF2194 domain-containing protein [Blautia schinkii]|uniref:DUF2194 domain-containing protein n=1 Tax=Blautia schinkii TaxID=180164 RepID=UPI00156EE2DC|nr:DUF2194 domain-containing protein [Blautia schinkii]NSK34825.1 DUF2194 domain-containing protein [Blautia schinkii]NSK65318.1 DUF2194 domain-containing protein [Blautia schinkii]